MNDEYVVTLGVQYADGKSPIRVICELYRGDSDECIDLMRRVSQPSHDQRCIDNWWVQFGRTADWERFVYPEPP
jgi:hypothetical protein